MHVLGEYNAQAANVQGISATALKKACRELGVERWPYCRKRQPQDASASDQESRADTARGSSSPGSVLSSNGTLSPADPSGKSEMCPPADLMELLHRNAVMVLQAAQKLEGGLASSRLP